MAVKKCPVCGASVKVANLERHVADNHPRAKVDLSALVTAEERRAAKRKTAPPPTNASGRRRTAVVVAVVLVAAALVATYAFTRPPEPGPPTGPGVGQVAPDFNLADTDGNPVSLSGVRMIPTPAPVLLEFMDIDGPASQTEARILVTVYDNYSARVRFLSVDIGNVAPQDNNSRVNAFRATYGTPWRYALDLASIVTDAYQVRTPPAIFIIDRNGIVTAALSGSVEGAYGPISVALDNALGR